MSETKHTWVDGPHGQLYHCQNCGISKVNDYSFYDTCELWAEHTREKCPQGDNASEAHHQAQVAALTVERDDLLKLLNKLVTMIKFDAIYYNSLTPTTRATVGEVAEVLYKYNV